MKPTDYLVTPNLDDPDGWTYPIRHADIAAMETLHAGHGPDDAELRTVVRERPIGLLLHGNSIAEFETRADEFAPLDLCYMSVNRFNPVEDNILRKMWRQLELLFCFSEQDMPLRYTIIMEFLDRPTHNILITSYSALSWLQPGQWRDMLRDYGHKIHIRPRLLCRPAYPPSILFILDMLQELDIHNIILFGADGWLPSDMKDKWNQKAMAATYYHGTDRPVGLVKDTLLFNKLYIPRGGVWNCSPGSHLTGIPVITYDRLKETVNGI